MELKVVCNCGQKYKFDVEPVNGQMPFTVNCPVCGLDGTASANNLLMQMAPPIAVAAAAPAMAAAQPAGLSIRRETASTTVAAPPPVPAAATAAPPARGRPTPSSHTPAPAVPKYMQNNPAIQNNSFIMGIVGAILGAAVAVGFMVGTDKFFGFSFPYFGTIMGAIIGFGARLLYRGTDFTLGAMSAVVALITIGATLFLMFGLLGIAFSLISLVIGVGAAFKIASG